MASTDILTKPMHPVTVAAGQWVKLKGEMMEKFENNHEVDVLKYDAPRNSLRRSLSRLFPISDGPSHSDELQLEE
ncbi:hypothetical protein chiPu_0018710 [Chiloscyllium punctatum]|uniref:Uncharacterized protein n=1 Tax=Chiloscyllium punctatum TaxID=137246 RepID=A0A401RPE7_CHIPU|nr:hypothetical protein [Chiloscyllium punctatum]